MNETTSSGQRSAEQLLQDFSLVSHVPTAYINKTLSVVGSQHQISQSVHTLLNDLENASAIASKKLNALVDDMLRTAPRLGYGVEVLRGSLQDLRAMAAKTEPKRDVLSRKGEAAIQKLVMLENVKRKMQMTQKVFEDAKAWSPPELIEESIGNLIAFKEYSAASKQVLFYEGLLHVYRGTSEFARRKAVLDRIRRKLLDVKQDGMGKSSLDLARSSIDTQRLTESSGLDEGYYSSFIKRAFKT
ncbi:protein of unknown function [Taphrina deformans PYCC 5710]|uniref:Conserved oligomeric Golgi complex subunit 7 n=1 Tax=Taphrina deformans (strain PYCC 5710 / ATCC 11124 / CBS 356.35 / IMI 108563 / JCM 9778 / NBRC 8474) TaxID=1097556 RepID=R4XDH6_TAPDE|nr:protein of unknown function [Taphrina deformans PYCC 5710]|eukprot:CCG83931.1 protein of unknown function [Taphrina deformans PYCC 5710]